MKIYQRCIDKEIKKSLLNFGSHPPLNSGNFWRILWSTDRLQDRAFFNNLAHASRKTDQIFTKILSCMDVPWNKEIPVNFGSYPDRDPDCMREWILTRDRIRFGGGLDSLSALVNLMCICLCIPGIYQRCVIGNASAPVRPYSFASDHYSTIFISIWPRLVFILQ